jgi:hypothetical protein
LVPEKKICLPAYYPYCAEPNEDHDYGEYGSRDEFCRDGHGRIDLRRAINTNARDCVW